MVVAPMVTGERLGEDDARHDGRPLAAPAQFLETSALRGQSVKPVGVQHHRHGERRRMEDRSAWCAQALASARSASLVGPSSKSSSPR